MTTPPAVPPQGEDERTVLVDDLRRWRPDTNNPAFADYLLAAGYRKSTPPAARQVEALREATAEEIARMLCAVFLDGLSPQFDNLAEDGKQHWLRYAHALLAEFRVTRIAALRGRP